MSESAAIRVHRRFVMARRVKVLASAAAKLIPINVRNILDVGAGTGELASALQHLRKELVFSGVDVLVREKTLIPIESYDGLHLPFSDKSIDAVMLIDVLHHCEEPLLVLQECIRVARKGVLIKDHVSESRWQHCVLAFMDWIGNRAHKVALPNNYWSNQQWQNAMLLSGAKIVKKIDILPLYPVALAWLFGGRLHNFWWIETKDMESNRD
ncbi:methyltransferase family protein [Paraperlucidibaca baekdonensis]|uniref:Methyltransferase family protein n=1 Tax=Paraperlucidibaca baekdonensis TaxID=748120 RepID=A0A3E0H697_9GAMM|nr:class I SAM-dependent methyltransferase [Paraperlucidibaca baekdonensis]REH39023.1 methyltransferase family protein [Paraperlucidibaca baekdonensis]